MRIHPKHTPIAMPAVVLSAKTLKAEFVKVCGPQGAHTPEEFKIDAPLLPEGTDASEAQRVLSEWSDDWVTPYKLPLHGQTCYAVVWYGGSTNGVELFNASGQRFASGEFRGRESCWTFGPNSSAVDAAKHYVDG